MIALILIAITLSVFGYFRCSSIIGILLALQHRDLARTRSLIDFHSAQVSVQVDWLAVATEPALAGIFEWPTIAWQPS
jgi:hypothetical protein